MRQAHPGGLSLLLGRDHGQERGCVGVGPAVSGERREPGDGGERAQLLQREHIYGGAVPGEDPGRGAPEAVLEGSAKGWVTDLQKNSSGGWSLPRWEAFPSGGRGAEHPGARSACFTVECGEKDITFRVTGFGHGVGMSQYGAVPWPGRVRAGRKFCGGITGACLLKPGNSYGIIHC